MTYWDFIKKLGSPHYKTDDAELIDLARDGGYLRGSVIFNNVKYSYRNRNTQNPVKAKDIQKIIHYTLMLYVEADESPDEYLYLLKTLIEEYLDSPVTIRGAE